MSTITIRVDDDVKNKAEKIYKDLGLNMSTAVNMFLRQSVEYRGYPLPVRIPQYNAETIAAMEEARKISNDPNAKGFDDIDELFAELNKDANDEI